MSLTAIHISKYFSVSSGPLMSVKGKVHALNNVSFDLEEGGSLGIVGESGSGKTTLAKILAGFHTADAGEALFNGQSLLRMKRQERAGIVQMVFQDPFASLNPKLILRTQLLEAIPGRHSRPVSTIQYRRDVPAVEIHDQTARLSLSGIQTFQNLDARFRGHDGLAEAARLMKAVGLTEEFLGRYPHQLSGGQRQRFAIARALARNPKILIADEPVSNLDISVQAQMINLLNDIRRQFGLTLITISHDLAVIANLAERIIVMKDGVLIEEGDSQHILTHPSTDYTKKLLASMPLV